MENTKGPAPFTGWSEDSFRTVLDSEVVEEPVAGAEVTGRRFAGAPESPVDTPPAAFTARWGSEAMADSAP